MVLSSGHQPFVGVKSVLVVLSSKSQAFDLSAFRNLITHAYPGCAVFFVSTSGDSVGIEGPQRVDLVIDFTPAGARQSFFFAASMRRRAKFAVGRAAGWYFRKSKYDRIFDEKLESGKPDDFLASEGWAQRRVLELAGIPVVREGGVTPDRSKEIALDLPPLSSR